MSLEKTNVIDAISISHDSKVVLILSDNLAWDEKKHLHLLVEKLNFYIHVLQTRYIDEIYPESSDKEFLIQIVCKYSPDAKGKTFLDSVAQVFETLPYHFSYGELNKPIMDR
ncbi:DUF6572 domain-containing protein [Chryseobacterium sp.]|uniref:DUF6572 domain-containing protein n=1 Tax=Chryseobacterium sp. TaxID=1871047 RepID=UPI0025C32410|nr:DUF6572 domain-containing protein [Chryseobacterium sp.]MBV8325170.1 hypothetical protein [Chryseobacterium sp.]